MGRARSSTAAVAAPPRRSAVRALPDIVPDEDWFQLDPAVLLEAKQVARELNVHEVVAARLVMLGLDAEQVTAYLHPGPQHINHPDETVPGMTAAAKDLAAAVGRGELIAVYADYDVDGQTSLAILADTLETYDARLHAGSATATSGFGLTRDFVESAHKAGAKWLVTVDCGSTQTEPVRLAQSLGMQVLVIDHHDVDPANPAEHHLNPRVRAVEAINVIADTLLNHSENRQKDWKPDPPYADALDKLTDRSRELLSSELGPAYLQALEDDIHTYGHPTNSGAMLTWKFASALHLAHHDPTPAGHWGRPLYLAGLGAIADMMPADDMEVRAMVRVPVDSDLQRDVFGADDTVPTGVRMLADALGEDASRADLLIRTRALLNLPKRTAEIDPADIQTILRSDDPAELSKLIPGLVSNYERLSAIRRDEMDPAAMTQIEAAQAGGEHTYFNYPQLDGFENYSGYARMVANNAARKTGKPTIAFVRRGVDEYGQELWKFSGANDCVPEAKLGDLIHREDMTAACTVRMRDWVGDEAAIPNLGGHSEVVSGVCTTENIEKVRAACEAWASEKDHKKKWRPIETKRPRVAKRRVSPLQLRKLERDALLLAPLKFPEQPAVQVSVVGAFEKLKMNPDRQAWEATMRLDDGSTRPVLLSDDVAATARAHRRRRFEAIVALGKPEAFYISTVAPA